MAFVDFVVEAAPGLLAELHPPVKSREVREAIAGARSGTPRGTRR